jgi:hypothetical protein
MLIRILVTGIHADKISVARKKKKNGASLSEEEFPFERKN